MINGVIYCYYQPQTNKYYIGQTVNSIARRNKWYSGNYCGNNSKIDRARKKYGVNSFIYSVLNIKQFNTKEMAKYWLNDMEILYINQFNSYDNGYNSTHGGNGSIGFKHSIETIELLKLINHKENHPKFGTHLSEVTKKKISEGNKGKIISIEQRKQISSKLSNTKHPNFGKHLDIVTKKKISEANKGKIISIEQKHSISLSHMKSVDVYDLNMIYIETMDSIDLVAKKYDIKSRRNISKCCNGGFYDKSRGKWVNCYKCGNIICKWKKQLI